LAKQGWRLPQNPNSLAAKVLKEKYYLETTFLGSQLGLEKYLGCKKFYGRGNHVASGEWE
jgi:hypothetical protein